jgi:multiple sugar transport system permease protein
MNHTTSSYDASIRRHRNLSSAANVLAFAFLLAVLVVTLYPLLYVVLGSFKTNRELVLGGSNLLPARFSLDNYREAWKLANFARYTVNSVFLGIVVMVGVVIFSSMAGYCFSRRTFWGSKILYGLLMAFMFVSIGSVNLRPLFALAVKLGAHKSLWTVALICIGANLAANVFLVRSYLSTVPRELDEAAEIDGCGFFGTYRLIIFPVMTPVLATIALLSFRAAWNEYILPLVFTMTNQNLRPLTVGVVSLKNVSDGAAAWNIMFAGSTMSIIPIIVLFLFTSRYFMSGLTAGSVKG